MALVIRFVAIVLFDVAALGVASLLRSGTLLAATGQRGVHLDWV